MRSFSSRFFLAVALLSPFMNTALAQEAAQSASPVQVKEGGGGVSLVPNENVKLTFMGYMQANQKIYGSEEYKAAADYPLTFLVRRARLDFMATLYQDHELFIEIDGAPSTDPASPSGFALVEARMTSKLLGDALAVRFGKFVVPFSAEAMRSSRAVDSVERSIVLNSLYGLPAIDTQYGGMIFGKTPSNLSWYLVAANGNGKAAANTNENNSGKEYIVRLSQKVAEGFNIGLTYDITSEKSQTLKLNDLLGGNLTQTAVKGKRVGYVADMGYSSQGLTANIEYVTVRWDDKAVDTTLSGGFLLLGYFVSGSEQGGFQPIIKMETAKIEIPGGAMKANTLSSITAGWNWYVNPAVRNQFNVIATSANDANGVAGSPYEKKGTRVGILNSFQYKF